MAHRFGFILEQTLGHSTYDANLRTAVANDQQVRAAWAAIDFASYGRLERLPLLRNWTLRAGRQTRRQLAMMQQSGRLDGLFFHTQTVAVLAIDWLRRIPSVVSLDATPLQFDRIGAAYGHTTNSALIEQLKARLHRACYRAAHQLVTWSQWTAASLVADYGVPASKISVIAPGVTIDFWRRTEPVVRTPGPVRVLFVGGDFWRKGGAVLLAAARALPAGTVELHIVTGTKLGAEPGVHVYHGMQPSSVELRALYHGCDIFCLPTIGDCMPLVLSEAAAAGLPVISTALAAIPEVVRHGETGLLVPPDDVAALTTALRFLVEAPERRQELGMRAAALAATHFDARRNAGLVLDLLKHMASHPSAAVRRASSIAHDPL